MAKKRHWLTLFILALALLVYSVNLPTSAHLMMVSQVNPGLSHSHSAYTRLNHNRKHTLPPHKTSPAKHLASHHHLHHAAPAHHLASVHQTRHAYPVNFFMLNAPEFNRELVDSQMADKIRNAFDQGTADDFSARALVRAGVVQYAPLSGGIFWRREPIKYIIVHSTETGVPQDARHVIASWSHGGRRHAGAQFVVDRDGTIYEAVDPDLATVHVNIFKTLPGINNDNSVGIEMCHWGHINYPPEQKQAVVKLVTYLQNHYYIANDNIITHRYAQQGDHTDPVAFDWEGFLAHKNRFRISGMDQKMNILIAQARSWSQLPNAPTLLQIHNVITSRTKAPFTTKASPHAVPATTSKLSAQPTITKAPKGNWHTVDLTYSSNGTPATSSLSPAPLHDKPIDLAPSAASLQTDY